MTIEDSTMRALKESGRRLTPQRLMVLSAVRDASGHVTASDVMDLVKENYPYIDASTVYRTLNVLKEMRLISETDMGSGEYIYEWIQQERHHHLICSGCDRVTVLDHKYMENLGTEILDDYGFQPDIDHFAVFGLCGECRQNGDALPDGRD